MKHRLALNSPEKRKHWYKYYKVYKNDTSVIEMFINDFKPFNSTLVKIKAACALRSGKYPGLFLPDDNFMFCGFLSKIKTMEYAKAGALNYIAELIAAGEPAANKLMEYREAHYDDLNFNLTERNIRQFEMALKP
jgi:hypothetical protein